MDRLKMGRWMALACIDMKMEQSMKASLGTMSLMDNVKFLTPIVTISEVLSKTEPFPQVTTPIPNPDKPT